jgi:hypothetical protein
VSRNQRRKKSRREAQRPGRQRDPSGTKTPVTTLPGPARTKPPRQNLASRPPPGLFRRREAPINRNEGPKAPHAWHLRDQARSIAILRIIDTDKTGRHYFPKFALKVVSKEQVRRLSEKGGLVPFLEEELGPGTYRCEWIGPDCYVLDRQVVEIEDVKALQTEHSHRRRELERSQRQAKRRQEQQRAFEKAISTWTGAVLDHPALWAPLMPPLQARQRTIALLHLLGPDLLRMPTRQVWWIIEGALTSPSRPHG